MEIIESQKKKPLLLYLGFIYRKDTDTVDGGRTWRCTVTGCRGRIKTLSVGNEIIHKSEHNHAPSPPKVECSKVIAAIRVRAATGVEKPRQIIQQSTNGMTLEAASQLPSYEAERKIIQRERKRKQQPYPNPQNVMEIDIPEVLRKSTRGEDFLLWDSGKEDEKRMIIFGTMENLHLLGRHAHWFVDGTFAIAPLIFYQVFTVHSLINNKAVPLVYVLLCDKTEETYRRVFDKIKEITHSVKPLSIMSDFEKACQNAIRSSYPESQLVGCLFHLGQCMWRKVQDLNLTDSYRDDENFRMHVKMLLALSFVPVADVINAFEQLTDECPDEFQPLVDYWEDNYIGRKRRTHRANPRFSLTIWNVYDRVVNDLPRTNNSVEAWHRCFQQTLDCQHPSVFKLIEQFRKEQDHVEIQLERFHGGERRPEASKSKYVQLNKRIKNIADSYRNLPLIDYLRTIAHNLTI